MKRVKDCKDVSIMSPQDEQLFVYCNFLVLLRYNRMESKHKKNVNIADETLILRITAFSVGITILNQRII